MLRTTGVLTLMMLIGLSTVGCSRPYVNIPAQRGSVAAQDPNADNVRDIQVVALEAVLNDQRITGPVEITLPEGTSTLSYEAVLPRVSEAALRPGEGEAAASFTVEGVRIRGWDGHVDISRPATGGHRQLVTVTLDYRPMTGWTARRLQPWRSLSAPDDADRELAPQTPTGP